MCMSETVKKEKEDFKKLYEGIQNDVVRERIRASGEWYIERATKYKRIFFIDVYKRQRILLMVLHSHRQDLTFRHLVPHMPIISMVIFRVPEI